MFASFGPISFQPLASPTKLEIEKKYHYEAVNVIGARPTGLALVQNLDPHSRVLAERQHEIIDEFLALDMSVLDGRKDEMLNRFPNDWTSIAGLIDARGRAQT